MAQPSLKTIVYGASRRGVTVNRFRVTREQAEQILRCEAEHGHAATTALIVKMLFGRTPEA